MSAPQGCGKTTLVTQMERLFESVGMQAATLSLDDFYLRGHEQDSLAERGNRLLAYRGNAGTHDVQLGKETIEELKKCTNSSKQVALPRYDKSLRKGKGDRAEKSAWPTKRGPIDVRLACSPYNHIYVSLLYIERACACYLPTAGGLRGGVDVGVQP